MLFFSYQNLTYVYDEVFWRFLKLCVIDEQKNPSISGFEGIIYMYTFF